MVYICDRDVVEIGMVLVWIGFRQDSRLPSSGKLVVASPNE